MLRIFLMHVPLWISLTCGFCCNINSIWTNPFYRAHAYQILRLVRITNLRVPLISMQIEILRKSICWIKIRKITISNSITYVIIINIDVFIDWYHTIVCNNKPTNKHTLNQYQKEKLLLPLKYQYIYTIHYCDIGINKLCQMLESPNKIK